MATEKEGMVNGSSSTSRVSSNFVLARTLPLLVVVFIQMEIEVSTGLEGADDVAESPPMLAKRGLSRDRRRQQVDKRVADRENKKKEEEGRPG